MESREGGPAPGTVQYGSSLAYQRFGAEGLELHPFPPGASSSLCQLRQEYAFFTLAPLYWFSRYHFNNAALTDFLATAEHEARFYIHRFSRPLFSGFELERDDTLNHMLWAVNEPFSEVLRLFLCSIKIGQYDTKMLWGVGCQPYAILDPALAESPLRRPSANFPRLKIAVFGVNSPDGQLAMRPGPQWDSPPVFARFDPDPAVVAYTEAFFAGRDPQAAEQKVAKEEAAREVST